MDSAAPIPTPPTTANAPVVLKPILKLQSQTGDLLTLVTKTLKKKTGNSQIVEAFKSLNLLGIETVPDTYTINETRKTVHCCTISITDAEEQNYRFTATGNKKYEATKAACGLVVKFLRQKLLPQPNMAEAKGQVEHVNEHSYDGFIEMLVNAYKIFAAQNYPPAFILEHLAQFAIFVNQSPPVCIVKPKQTFSVTVTIGHRLIITGASTKIETAQAFAYQKVVDYLADLTIAYDVHAKVKGEGANDAMYAMTQPIICKVCDCAFENAKYFLDHQLNHLGKNE